MGKTSNTVKQKEEIGMSCLGFFWKTTPKAPRHQSLLTCQMYGVQIPDKKLKVFRKIWVDADNASAIIQSHFQKP